MKREKRNTLVKLIEKREQNILQLSKWSDDDINEMISRYVQAREIAEEENQFEFYKILQEKLSQLHDAKSLKYSLSDEASDWIHW